MPRVTKRLTRPPATDDDRIAEVISPLIRFVGTIYRAISDNEDLRRSWEEMCLSPLLQLRTRVLALQKRELQQLCRVCESADILVCDRCVADPSKMAYITRRERVFTLRGLAKRVIHMYDASDIDEIVRFELGNGNAFVLPEK
ncbi:hypothetical protein CYMTET_2519 [Cymbomonas tetramitiformis]|uniref:Uncharacterized protein n=1 Tax=Cymbomonas tetramitiformis TaxID=36881 RepID=A0AAE0H549_9CHLO|nr:hypothetical protein CYMTET_37374 [Cymbomonas tetramitiformis]KAK3290051.1 hypothetical protein CYMTET_2519 [Cymbomonas tetramitiformis]